MEKKNRPNQIILIGGHLNTPTITSYHWRNRNISLFRYTIRNQNCKVNVQRAMLAVLTEVLFRLWISPGDVERERIEITTACVKRYLVIKDWSPFIQSTTYKGASLMKGSTASQSHNVFLSIRFLYNIANLKSNGSLQELHLK